MRGAGTNPTVLGGSLADLSLLKDIMYQPITSWQGWFSPHITFGNNIEDKPVETNVLDAVGSYGSQINRIMDAMSVLVSRLHREELTPQEQFKISKFNELAALADKVTTDFQSKPRREEVTLEEVDRLLDAIEDLKISNHGAYARITTEIKKRV
jgi:hypothetical protein